MVAKAEMIIKRFSVGLNGLAKFSKKTGWRKETSVPQNPYLMAFNKSEVKKFKAAQDRLKEVALL